MSCKLSDLDELSMEVKMFKIALSALVILAGVFFGAAHITSSRDPATPQTTPSQNNRSVKEEPTQLRERTVLSEKQQAHRKLFKQGGIKLTEHAARTQGDVEIGAEVPYRIEIPQSGPKPPVLQTASCNADAIVIGVLGSKSSHFTEGESSIFTDQEVIVEDVIKDNASAPIQSHSTITVTRLGGAVRLSGRTYRFTLADFEPMEIGKRYLLFLRFIPATGAYRAYGSGSFRLDDNKVHTLGGDSVSSELIGATQKDATAFLVDVRTLAVSDCRKQ